VKWVRFLELDDGSSVEGKVETVSHKGSNCVWDSPVVTAVLCIDTSLYSCEKKQCAWCGSTIQNNRHCSSRVSRSPHNGKDSSHSEARAIPRTSQNIEAVCRILRQNEGDLSEAKKCDSGELHDEVNLRIIASVTNVG